MQPLNALDAIAPAFTRTHQVLFAPFRMGRSWKLAASAYVAFAGSIFLPFPLIFLGLPIPWTSRVAVFLLLLIPILILLVLFYLGVRMQSVHFEMVVTRAKFIAPMWKRYGKSSWPWLGLKVALGTVVTLVASPLLIARGRHMMTSLMALGSQLPRPDAGAQPDPAAIQHAMFGMFAQMISAVLPFYLVIIVVFMVLKFCSTLLEDFALPFAILEELSLGESLKRGARVIAADPLQTTLYLVLKCVLSIMGLIAQSVVNQFVLIPVAIVAVLVGVIVGLIGAALGAGQAGHVAAFVVGAVAGYGLMIVATLWAQIFTLGYLLTLLEAYAIYFLGGRYQKLGDYLEPPAYTYAPPPMPPAPDEEDDGPSLPMDPALA